MSEEELPTISQLVDTAILKIAEGEELAPEELTDAHAEKAFEVVSAEIYRSMCHNKEDFLSRHKHEISGFEERNRNRWGEGLDELILLRNLCIEAGQDFQSRFLEEESYVYDPLLGVLLRLHAHACRVAGAIIALLECGYADDAFARWRTLHELVVTALVLEKSGPMAAKDYVLYGIVQSVAGMNGYQETAAAMGREPYSVDEISEANKLRDRILAEKGDGFKSRNGWARKYIGASRFDKLQKAAGLDHWRNDYSSASRDVHTDYREMRSLAGMAEATQDLLLCGPSDSGMVEPAHATAIALAQITSTFLFTYSESGSKLDYVPSVVYSRLISRFSDEVGEIFMRLYAESGKNESAESLADEGGV